MQAFKYNKRIEEWASKPPLYCPVPQCSAFISPRLYASKRLPATMVQTQLSTGHVRSLGFFEFFGVEKQASACCPKCFTVVCTSCRKEYHGEGDDCDPATLHKEADLVDVQICPFCSAGVEHAGGCPIVGCSCGQYFCVECGAWPCTCEDGYA